MLERMNHRLSCQKKIDRLSNETTSPYEMIGLRNQPSFTNKIHSGENLFTVKTMKNGVKVERVIFDYIKSFSCLIIQNKSYTVLHLLTLVEEFAIHLSTDHL